MRVKASGHRFITLLWIFKVKIGKNLTNNLRGHSTTNDRILSFFCPLHRDLGDIEKNLAWLLKNGMRKWTAQFSTVYRLDSKALNALKQSVPSWLFWEEIQFALPKQQIKQFEPVQE